MKLNSIHSRSIKKRMTITSTSSTLMTKEADLLSPPPRGSIRRSSVATGDIAKIVSYHSATFSSAVRGDHYEVMAVQKGCHHAFCNPAAVKTHTRLTSPLSFKMSTRADPVFLHCIFPPFTELTLTHFGKWVAYVLIIWKSLVV